jgi:hypothetical protein
MELLPRSELLLAEIFRVFPIQHSFLAAVIVEVIGLVRDVLPLAYPARVGRGDTKIATGASAFGSPDSSNGQSSHLKPPSGSLCAHRNGLMAIPIRARKRATKMQNHRQALVHVLRNRMTSPLDLVVKKRGEFGAVLWVGIVTSSPRVIFVLPQ